jgi:tetratricopeptide (TPR) repeat protein
VRYLGRAGEQARERFAYNEAQAQLQRAIQLLRTLAESSARDARELDLLSELSGVLLITKGFAAPETLEVSARAVNLAERSGDLAQIVLQLHLSRVSAMTLGEHRKGAALASRMLEIAQRDGGVVGFAYAHHAGLQSHFYLGEIAEAEEDFERWTKFRDAYSKTAATSVVAALGAASLCAWIAGYPHQARERIAQAIDSAMDSNSPYDLVLARFFEHLLYRASREPRQSEAAAIQMMSLSEEHDIPAFNAQSPVAMGWVRAQSGHPEEAVSQIRDGLAGLMEGGIRNGITDSFVCLAEAQALSGAIDDALVTLEAGLQTNPEELVYRPNILTYRGTLRLMIGKPDLAEADFREAIALARRISARSWELRATTSLARMMRDSGRREEARAMLADIYNWFTEGFDTPDLKDAKALLEELNC